MWEQKYILNMLLASNMNTGIHLHNALEYLITNIITRFSEDSQESNHGMIDRYFRLQYKLSFSSETYLDIAFQQSGIFTQVISVWREAWR